MQPRARRSASAGYRWGHAVRPRRRPLQELCRPRFCCELAGVVPTASAASKWVAPSYPALALRRARGWIVERAFARIRAGAGANRGGLLAGTRSRLRAIARVARQLLRVLA